MSRINCLKDSHAELLEIIGAIGCVALCSLMYRDERKSAVILRE